MKNDKNEKLFSDWIKNEEKKLQKNSVNKKEKSQAKRAYMHFDKRRHSSSLFKIMNVVKFPEKVARMSFWPFIKFDINTPKYKKTSKGRKKTIKKRSVYYASHQDALIYSWYSYLINEKFYNKKLDSLGLSSSVVAYRKIPIKKDSSKNKCNIHIAKEIFDYINRKGECAVLVADITGFFDNLDHSHLKKEWCKVLDIGDSKLPKDHYTIYKNLTNFKYVEAEKLYKLFDIKYKKRLDKKEKKTYRVPCRNNKKIKNICSREEFVKKVIGLIKGNENKNKIDGSLRKGKTCGIMQGSPISATLSNLYMLSFDEDINNLVKDHNGMYRRYSDDLVIVCHVKDFQNIKKYILKNILKYELSINEDKTDSTFFLKDSKGGIRGYENEVISKKSLKNLQYLGFEYNGQNVFIRNSSVSRYYRKMKERVKKTTNMAYGKNSKTKILNNVIFKKTLYKKFLYKGRRSFISYALRASDIFNSQSIKKQLKGRFGIIEEAIKYRDEKHKLRKFLQEKEDKTKE